MYCFEVRFEGKLLYKCATLDVEDIIEEVKDWAGDIHSCYEMKIYKIPRLIVEVLDE